MALSLVLVVGMSLRVEVARTRPMHDDEIWGLMVAAGRGSMHLLIPSGTLLPAVPATTRIEGAPPLWRVPLSLGEATHPPGYYTLLGAWRRVFGGSEGRARGLSLVGSLGFLVLLFEAGRRWVSVEAGLWASGTMAVARPVVELTSMARPYACLMLALMVGLVGLERLYRKPGDARGAALGLGVAALMAPRPRRAMLAVVGAGLSCAIGWGPMFLGQARAGRFGMSELSTQFVNASHASLELTLTLLARAPVRPLFQAYRWPTVLWVILDLALAATAVVAWRRLPEKRRVPALVAVALGGIAAPAALDLLRHSTLLEFDRYIVLGMPGFLLVGAALTGEGRRDWGWARRIVPATFLGVAMLSWRGTYADRPDDYRRAAAWIDAHAPASAVVAVSGDPENFMLTRMQWLVYAHYAKRQAPILISEGNPPAAVQAQLKGRPVFVIHYPLTVPMAVSGHRRVGTQRIDALHAVTVLLPDEAAGADGGRP